MNGGGEGKDIRLGRWLASWMEILISQERVQMLISKKVICLLREWLFLNCPAFSNSWVLHSWPNEHTVQVWLWCVPLIVDLNILL